MIKFWRIEEEKSLYFLFGSFVGLFELYTSITPFVKAYNYRVSRAFIVALKDGNCTTVSTSGSARTSAVTSVNVSASVVMAGGKTAVPSIIGSLIGVPLSLAHTDGRWAQKCFLVCGTPI